jgi:hypothetical protein
MPRRKNTVLKKAIGPKREEFLGSWRRLHNEELRNLYASAYGDHIEVADEKCQHDFGR